jgi:uncharacterized protein YndB with AHSA1/START domain
MRPQATMTVRVTHRYRQDAQRVFDAWLDPEKAGKFLFSTPAGRMVRVEIDPRVGGSFLFVDRRDDADIEHKGHYVEIDRPRRLVFDFAVSGFEDVPTRVTVAITPLADGCELTLTHDGVWSDFADRTQAGWTMILDSLAASLGERDEAEA